MKNIDEIHCLGFNEVIATIKKAPQKGAFLLTNQPNMNYILKLKVTTQ
ncbi:hypothetical protein MBM09_13625 [Flaviramulus sp. BrNp1-15]|nr:hypothetical protein [Flaviramulus sp. BrNp1-15]ULC58947.1 hypothetical protein MBM09_13625 [Flaviramulus sp. BrNp1-15]